MQETFSSPDAYQPRNSPGDGMMGSSLLLPLPTAAQCKPCSAGRLPPSMAAVPEALEGMQLSQRFSGAAHQLQADMNALRQSLAALDFGASRGS